MSGLLGPTGAEVTVEDLKTAYAAFQEASQEVGRQKARMEALEAALARLLPQPSTSATVEFSGLAPAASLPLSLPRAVKPSLPANFHGSRKDAELLESWVFSVEEYFSLTDVMQDEMKIRVAGSLLRGSALTWYRSARSETAEELRVTTWAHFLRELRANFCPLNTTKLARDKLVTIRQTSSVREYIREFRTVLLDIPKMAEDEKLDRFVRGLKPHVRREVEIREPKDLADACRLSEHHDAAYRSTDFHNSGSNRYNKGNRPNRSSDGPQPMELNATGFQGPSSSKKFKRLTPQERQRLMDEGKCLYCREAGHMLRDCPKRPRSGNGSPAGRSPSRGRTPPRR